MQEAAEVIMKEHLSLAVPDFVRRQVAALSKRASRARGLTRTFL